MSAPVISREALLHVVKNLPTAPRILAQLGGLLLDPNADLTDVINLLKHDSALTVRVIRVSNSAVFGMSGRAASLEEALLRVGFNEVYRMVGLAAVAQIPDDPLHHYGVRGAQLRENSVFMALLMEAMAGALQMDPRPAYTAGLLRSTGKIALDRLIPGAVDSHSYSACGQGRPLDQWELDLVGTDNCAAAGLVLDEWHFPPEEVLGIRDHYRPGSDSPPLARLLNVAGGLAERAGLPLPGEATYWVDAGEQMAALGLAPADLEPLLLIAHERFARTRQVIG